MRLVHDFSFGDVLRVSNGHFRLPFFNLWGGRPAAPGATDLNLSCVQYPQFTSLAAKI